MEKVNITKSALLEKLKENRIVHEKEYTEMMEIYHQKVIEGLEDLLQRARSKESNPKTSLNLDVLISYLSEYDMIIGMLEMCTDEEFSITQNEYKKYVLNKWDWSNRFDMLKSTYVS